MTHRIITAEEARALREAATPGPWQWSVYKGRHLARLCTESQFESGEGWILQLDRDTINGRLADLIEAAPELAATVEALHAEVERLRDRLCWTSDRLDAIHAILKALDGTLEAAP